MLGDSGGRGDVVTDVAAEFWMYVNVFKAFERRAIEDAVAIDYLNY